MADSSSADDRLDLDRRELLAVTGPTNVVLATTKLEDDELVAEALLDDLGRDLRPRHRRSSDRHVLASPGATSSTWSNVTLVPASPSSFSTQRVWPGSARYCLPPVWITAYM